MRLPWQQTTPEARGEAVRDVGALPVSDTDALTPMAFAARYEVQMVPLYRYFYHHTSDAHDAEDLMGTTVTRALAGLPRYDCRRGSFAAWLFGIARHVLRDHQRRHRLVLDVTTLYPSPADSAPPLDARIVHGEEALLLHARIRRLPPAQRDALTLRYFAALSVAEIARVLGRSEGATKLLIHRALTTLRRQYREEDSHDPCP